MLNFLQISLTNRCNFSCWHCPMKEWRNTEPKFPLNNGELVPFLERNVAPEEWVVELTGGEPTLYGGFDELLEWLSEHGYYTIVKTNGSNRIMHYENVKVCAAFHNIERPPKFYDEFLIVDRIYSERKIAYCKEHGIPYKVVGYDKENPDGASHGFTYISFINAAGHGCDCPAKSPLQKENADGSHDFGRITDAPMQKSPCCKNCKAAIDAWRFLPEETRHLARVPGNFNKRG